MRLVTCTNCGRVHVGVSLEYAYGEVIGAIVHHQSLTEEEREEYGPLPMDRAQLLFRYLVCFGCGNFCSGMREFEEGDCPDGVTLTPIVAHSQLVFDGPE